MRHKLNILLLASFLLLSISCSLFKSQSIVYCDPNFIEIAYNPNGEKNRLLEKMPNGVTVYVYNEDGSLNKVDVVSRDIIDNFYKDLGYDTVGKSEEELSKLNLPPYIYKPALPEGKYKIVVVGNDDKNTTVADKDNYDKAKVHNPIDDKYKKSDKIYLGQTEIVSDPTKQNTGDKVAMKDESFRVTELAVYHPEHNKKEWFDKIEKEGGLFVEIDGLTEEITFKDGKKVVSKKTLRLPLTLVRDKDGNPIKYQYQPNPGSDDQSFDILRFTKDQDVKVRIKQKNSGKILDGTREVDLNKELPKMGIDIDKSEVAFPIAFYVDNGLYVLLTIKEWKALNIKGLFEKN